MSWNGILSCMKANVAFFRFHTNFNKVWKIVRRVAHWRFYSILLNPHTNFLHMFSTQECHFLGIHEIIFIIYSQVFDTKFFYFIWIIDGTIIRIYSWVFFNIVSWRANCALRRAPSKCVFTPLGYALR